MVLLRSWLPVIVALLITAGVLALPDAGMSSDERPQIEGFRGRIVSVTPRVLTDDDSTAPDTSLPGSDPDDETGPGGVDSAEPDATVGPEESIDIRLILDPDARSRPDPGPTSEPIPDTVRVSEEPDFQVLLLEGPRTGEVVGAWLGVASTATRVEAFTVGDEVVVTFTGQPDGSAFITVSDHYRLPLLAILAIVFVAAVLLVGRGQGLRALVALALTVALVLKVVVPQVLGGASPVPVALVVAGIVTVVTIGLTEGFRRPSVAAMLGTIGGLAVTGIASWLVTEAARFSIAGAEDLLYLWSILGGTLDIRGLLLAGFILGALGVLDDVSVTQAATVEALAVHSGLRGRALYSSALRVGRSHIGATVNTLFLAYVGVSLPLVVLFVITAQSAGMVLNSEIVAIEIVRTLAGGLGIVAAVPLTTLIATLLEDRAAHPPPPRADPWATPGVATVRVQDDAASWTTPRPRSSGGGPAR